MSKKTKVRTLWLHGDIDEALSLGVIQECKEALANKEKSVILDIHSFGGSTTSATRILEAIKDLKRNGVLVTAFCGGAAASSAFGVFMACPVRVCSRYATFMQHPIGLHGVNSELLKKDIKLHHRNLKAFSAAFDGAIKSMVPPALYKKYCKIEKERPEEYILGSELAALGLAELKE